MRWSDEQLMGIAEELIEELPEDLRGALENVSILIQDLPATQQEARLGLPPGRLLLGLYEGTPLSQRSVFHPTVFPTTIYLFRKNIERAAGTLADVKAELRRTLFHEIGHHLGFNEDDLRQRGL